MFFFAPLERQAHVVARSLFAISNTCSATGKCSDRISRRSQISAFYARVLRDTP